MVAGQCREILYGVVVGGGVDPPSLVAFEPPGFKVDLRSWPARVVALPGRGDDCRLYGMCVGSRQRAWHFG